MRYNAYTQRIEMLDNTQQLKNLADNISGVSSVALKLNFPYIMQDLRMKNQDFQNKNQENTQEWAFEGYIKDLGKVHCIRYPKNVLLWLQRNEMVQVK